MGYSQGYNINVFHNVKFSRQHNAFRKGRNRQSLEQKAKFFIKNSSVWIANDPLRHDEIVLAQLKNIHSWQGQNLHSFIQ